jgi:hypothetical protein
MLLIWKIGGKHLPDVDIDSRRLKELGYQCPAFIFFSITT